MIQRICFCFFTFFVFASFLIDQTEQIQTAETATQKKEEKPTRVFSFDDICNVLIERSSSFKDEEALLSKKIKVNVEHDNIPSELSGFDLIRNSKHLTTMTPDHQLTYLTKVNESFHDVINLDFKKMEQREEVFKSKIIILKECIDDLKALPTTDFTNNVPEKYKKYNINLNDMSKKSIMLKIKKYADEKYNELQAFTENTPQNLSLTHYLHLYLQAILLLDLKEPKLKDILTELKKLDEKLEDELSVYGISIQKSKLSQEMNVFSTEYDNIATLLKTNESPLKEKANDENYKGKSAFSQIKNSTGLSNMNKQSEESKTQKHIINISTLIKNYVDKISVPTTKNHDVANKENDKTDEEDDDIEIDEISQFLESIKNNEEKLIETIKDLRSLISKMQKEKAQIDAIYNELMKGKDASNNVEEADDVEFVERIIKEFVHYKEQAEIFLQKLTGKSVADESDIDKNNNGHGIIRKTSGAKSNETIPMVKYIISCIVTAALIF